MREQWRLATMGAVIGVVVGAGVAVAFLVLRAPVSGGNLEGRYGACFTDESKQTGRVLSEYDGKSFSSAEIPADLREGVLQAEAEFYRRMMDLGDQMLARYHYAKEKGLNTEIKQLPTIAQMAGNEVSENEVREFYEKNRQSFSNRSYESMKVTLRNHLQQQLGNRFVQKKIFEIRKEKSYQPRLSLPCGPKEEMPENVETVFRGSDKAKLQLYVFGSYSCGACRYMKAMVDGLAANRGAEIGIHEVMFSEKPGTADEYLIRGLYCARKVGDAKKQSEYHGAAFGSVSQFDEAGKPRVGGDVKRAAREVASHVQLSAKEFDECLSLPEAEAATSSLRQATQTLGVLNGPVFFLNGHRMLVPAGVNVAEALNRILDETKSDQK